MSVHQLPGKKSVLHRGFDRRTLPRRKKPHSVRPFLETLESRLAPATLSFLAQPTNTPTGVLMQPVTVELLDGSGHVITSDNTDTVVLGIASGPGSFLAGSTTSATMVNGVATFSNLTLVVPGSYTLSESVPGLYSGPNSAAFNIAPLQVVPGSFQGTPTGFSVQFNAPYLANSTTPVLYGLGWGLNAASSSFPAGTGQPPTVILTTDGTNLQDTAAYVAGTLALNTATNSMTFIETDTTTANNQIMAAAPHPTPNLPDGTYFAVIRGTNSVSPNGLKYNGLQALNSGGGFLDGTNAGTPGHDFIATFTINNVASNNDVVWVPATADGPLQGLNAPGNNQHTLFTNGHTSTPTGLPGLMPVYIDDTSGNVTSVTGTFTYNPTLLTVTGDESNVALTGSTFVVTVTTPGTATFT